MTEPTDQDRFASGLAQFVRAELLRKYGGDTSDGESLTALLDGGEVREERGVRVTWPDGHVEDMWGNDRMASGQTLSEYRYEVHNSDQTRTNAERIHRFVIVTVAQPVDPGSEGNPS